jgi:hypothetical protein
VEHSYNLDGVCSCLSFLPSKKTESLLANAGLLYKKTTDGIQIVYDKDNLEALKLYVQDQQEPLSFDFKVYSQDPDFKSYTEPYTAVTDSVLYFDNRAISGSGEQNLSVSKNVSNKDFKKMDTSELKDIISPKDRLLPPEFVVRIFANNDKGQLLKQWLEPEPTIYSIRFDSRQRYWKYYLLGKLVSKNISNNAFRVFDPDKQFEFESTGEELLSDQSVAYTFRSKKQIPFNDYYPFRFQLKQKGQGDEVVVINQLPVASVKQIGTEKIADHATVVAEIYINS